MLFRLLPLVLFACSTPAKPEASSAAPGPVPGPVPATAEGSARVPALASTAQLVLPGGAGGIGFDDLGFSPVLHRVLAPAGRTGTLDLIDPASRAIESIAGFSTDATFGGGHGEGTTSVDEGGGFLFATDRGRAQIAIVDPVAKSIVGTVKLAGTPDYVRWIDPVKEVWVTEPGKKQIEYFALVASKLVRKGVISVPGGPESLVVDATRGRAYTHTWDGTTVVIDLARHAEVARWKNGCEGSRGIALDEARGFLFVGCEEGKAIALDVAHDGKQLGTVATGKGVDIIAYDPARAHLYVPGGDSATLTIIGVAPAGTLAVLATVPAAADAHCVTADDTGHAYVCDPKHGSLIVVTDPFPATR